MFRGKSGGLTMMSMLLILSGCNSEVPAPRASDDDTAGAMSSSSPAARRQLPSDEAIAADGQAIPATGVSAPGATSGSNTAATGFPADMVVVRANGPTGGEYPIGRTLVSGTQISLMAGDRLVLLGGGGTRTLAGPGTFLSGGADFPSGAAQNISLLYAAALFQADGQSAIAATRRVIAPPNIANAAQQMPPGLGLWAYALGTSGNHCLPDLRDFVVSTRPAPFERTITITPAAGDAARRLTLAANSARVGRYGPQMTNGARYRIGFERGDGTVARIVQIAVDRDNAAALASALARAGCSAQLDRLLARMNGLAPSAPPLVASPPPRSVMPRPPIEVRPVPPRILSPRPRVINPAASAAPVNPAVSNAEVNEAVNE